MFSVYMLCLYNIFVLYRLDLSSKKAIPQLVNDALPTKAEAPQERVIKEVLPKWKTSKKISTI